MFQFAGFPSVRYVLAHGYMGFPHVGSPIQTPADRKVFAPPRSFSQLVASFFGSQCQGIRPVPFLLDLSRRTACSVMPAPCMGHAHAFLSLSASSVFLCISSNKKSLSVCMDFSRCSTLKVCSGSHLLSHAVPGIVPSAARALTIVLGMGTGVSPGRIATGNLSRSAGPPLLLRAPPSSLCLITGQRNNLYSFP